MSKFPGSPIALVGFMGSGKTTIGKALAYRLNLRFVDLDSRIVEEAGISIPEIFQKFGEKEFRRLESDMLMRETMAGHQVIMACGGGIVESEKNRKALTEICFTIWLDVPEKELLRRLKEESEGRPMLSGDLASKVRMLLDRRNPSYQAVASMRHGWTENELPEATAEKITTRLQESSDMSL